MIDERDSNEDRVEIPSVPVRDVAEATGDDPAENVEQETADQVPEVDDATPDPLTEASADIETGSPKEATEHPIPKDSLRTPPTDPATHSRQGSLIESAEEARVAVAA